LIALAALGRKNLFDGCVLCSGTKVIAIGGRALSSNDTLELVLSHIRRNAHEHIAFCIERQISNTQVLRGGSVYQGGGGVNEREHYGVCPSDTE
jgi:hypothetical protein